MLQRSGLPVAPQVVSLVGDIDLAAAEAVHQTLMRALNDTTSDRFEVDLSAVRFLDSSGIRVLIQARKYAAERGITFVLTHLTEPVARVLATLGLQDYLGLPAPTSP
jgi:anti-sigma B factor antagonist